MARTKRNAMLIEEARSKIRTTQLLNRLQDHAVGKVKMSPTQIQATAILLKKVVPDLQAISHEGEVNVNYVAQMPGPIADADEWQAQHEPSPTVQ